MHDNKIGKILKALKQSALKSRGMNSDAKRIFLMALSESILHSTGMILKANALDLKALKKGTPSAFRDRLTLDQKRIEQIASEVKLIAEFRDPVGAVVEKRTLENGLRIQKIRAPLGVVLVIYESRPNVTIDAFSLCFKSGNIAILRGGKEALKTNQCFFEIIQKLLKKMGHDENLFWGVSDSDRGILKKILTHNKEIDVVIPRGGESLISFVSENSKIPIIKNDRGMCHLYIHSDANFKNAEKILENSKCQRPGVCNAVETLLIHADVAPTLLPLLYDCIKSYSVEWITCPASYKILKRKASVKKATSKSWDKEYLDFKLNCKIVASEDEAIAHIQEYGSKHSESILTETENVARRFQNEIDAAVLYWNASTRFTDGNQLGLGSEIGISTQKLHVRGPLGAEALTSARWVIDGDGHIRTGEKK